MPTFEDRARAEAPPEEVWKLLYDPARFPEWWVGVGSIVPDVPGPEASEAPGAPGTGGEPGRRAYTMYPEGYPDFPMPQELATSGDGHRVSVSCLVSDLRFSWRLEPADGGSATVVSVEVEIPESEARRLGDQRAFISASLQRLTRLAADADA